MAFKLSGFPTHQTKATVGGVTPFKHGTVGEPDHWDIADWTEHYNTEHGGEGNESEEEQPNWWENDPTANDPTNWATGDPGWMFSFGWSADAANQGSGIGGTGFSVPGIYPNKAKIQEWVDKGTSKVSEFFAGQGGGQNIVNLGGTGDFKWPWE
tara:strand:- start:47 stop:508 length:462 start_codon:yes stop_codon:yes gene_type:complete